MFFVSPSKDVDHTIHCCHCHTNSRGRCVATSLHDRPCSRVEIKNMHFIVQWYSGFKFTTEYICLGSYHGHSMWASGLRCAIRLGHLPTSILIRFKLQKWILIMENISHSFTVRGSGECLLFCNVFAMPSLQLVVNLVECSSVEGQLEQQQISFEHQQPSVDTRNPGIPASKYQLSSKYKNYVNFHSFMWRSWRMPATLCYLQQFCDANLQLIVKLIFSNANSTSWTRKLEIFQHPYISGWMKDFLPITHIN